MFTRKLQHPRQDIIKKGKFIWEQAVFYRCQFSKFNYFYANLCKKTV